MRGRNGGKGKEMNKELLEALDILEKEREISKETLFEAIENSLLTACKNHFGKADNIKVEINRETCDFLVYAEKEVVETKEEVEEEFGYQIKEIEEKDHVRNFQPPISGEMIMEMFKLPPSPMVGALKNALKEAVLDGIIHNDYDEAQKFIINKAKELGVENIPNNLSNK